MSRLFASTGTDRISVTATNQAPIDQGPITVGVLVRVTSTLTTDQWFLQGTNASGNPTWGVLISGGKLYNEGNFGSGGPSLTLNEWYWVFYTKAKGSVPPRWHVKNLTAGTAWVHVNDTANTADNNGPTTTITIGGRNQGTSSLRGNQAVAATWNRPLSDTDIENLTVSAQTLNRAHPAWGTILNQSSTATAIPDISSFGATQASLFGTSVDAAEPPGWDYTIVSPPQTLFGGEVPASYDISDNTAYSLGTSFTPNVDGVVTHMRQFVPATDQTQVASYPLVYKAGLYDGFGNPISIATFDPNGWDNAQWVDFPFDPPVAVSAGHAYMIVRYTPNRYTASPGYSWPKVSSGAGNLTAPSGAGFYHANYTDIYYPTDSFNNANYFTDVVFFPDASVAPSGPTFKLWNGTAEVPVTVKLWNGSSEVPVSLSSIT